jgi:hypothetical protein
VSLGDKNFLVGPEAQQPNIATLLPKSVLLVVFFRPSVKNNHTRTIAQDVVVD